MNNAGKILFSFALMVLMLLKVSAIHIYEHSEEDSGHEECHLCELAMENQVAELELQPDFRISPEVISHIDIVKTFGQPKTKVATTNKSYFFLRPPPRSV
ncbi:hypothetical protein [Croceivirga thetidis]|uniref:DUF2607 family protein n=1 Tax=Croceivirga thetidis TaxID=2721623 RepID=A0ABX1GQK5_9FLAO|nr:hypothetical protein [Croceivirga thetidis]NKI32198.1 hypothetical protein [Croceivirga thetidis]